MTLSTYLKYMSSIMISIAKENCVLVVVVPLHINAAAVAVVVVVVVIIIIIIIIIIIQDHQVVISILQQ